MDNKGCSFVRNFIFLRELIISQIRTIWTPALRTSINLVMEPITTSCVKMGWLVRHAEYLLRNTVTRQVDFINFVKLSNFQKHVSRTWRGKSSQAYLEIASCWKTLARFLMTKLASIHKFSVAQLKIFPFLIFQVCFCRNHPKLNINNKCAKIL